MDQGGELYCNPKVHQLFKEFGCALQPTGAGASNQNGTVKRDHCTIPNHIRCLSDGANLQIKFWPCAFHHVICILNGSVGSNQTKSPAELSVSKKKTHKTFELLDAEFGLNPQQPAVPNSKTTHAKAHFLVSCQTQQKTQCGLTFTQNAQRLLNMHVLMKA